MKRLCAVFLLLSALAIALWGCDVGGLPTPTPVAPTATAELPTIAPLPIPTSTTLPAPTLTPTIEEASPTPVPTETATPEIATATAITELPTNTAEMQALPTATARPRPTRTATKEAEAATSTSSSSGEEVPTASVASSPTAGAAEKAPTGGWGEVVRVAPGKKRIALTFDAGASGKTIQAILAALRQHNVHITMFITGKFAEQYPDGIKQMVADGHEIANHTYSHLDSRTLSDAQLKEELARTETIIQNLTGVSTKPFWRTPFGARNNHVLNVAVSQGYRSIYWTLDSLDSVGQPKTPDFIFNRVTNTPGVNLDGAIILQHFGSEASAEALPRELDRLQEMGLQVVTISQLLSP